MNTKPVVKVERMHLLDGEGPTKAFCDLLILDTFCIKGLIVIQGKEGLFVGMPSDQAKDGKWYETFYPVAKEMRKGLQELVLGHYNENSMQKA